MLVDTYAYAASLDGCTGSLLSVLGPGPVKICLLLSRPSYCIRSLSLSW